MFKMIIADDEPVITKGIQKLIDWKKLGIEIVEVYEDGYDAYKGIVAIQPDIALLDISMPHKTGLEILTEIQNLGIKTKVIFFSGFEEFDYVREAIRLGAKDYILKPIKQQLLIEAIQKCIIHKETIHETDQANTLYFEDDQTLDTSIYSRLVEMESAYYSTMLIVPKDEEVHDKYERQLTHFSVLSSIEEYVSLKHLGITFCKNNNIVGIIKEHEYDELNVLIFEMAKYAEKNSGTKIDVILSESCNEMKDIPRKYEKCLEYKSNLYFTDKEKINILKTWENNYRSEGNDDQLIDARSKLIDAILIVDQKKIQWELQRIQKIVYNISNGRREDACFHYYSCMHFLYERIYDLHLPALKYDMDVLLDEARKKNCYQDMVRFYEQIFYDFSERISGHIADHEYPEIYEAKSYIENNYSENINLEVIAGIVHMNPYYFSSYFKKHVGINFKEFLNEVRLKHALELLISESLKNYEIANRVGFPDVRSFTKIFKKYYGETPNDYKKRMNG